ncbi:MAG: CehA/McbA family metallohydrolase [Nannocystaceae bacterium]
MVRSNGGRRWSAASMFAVALWMVHGTAAAGEMVIPISGDIPQGGLDHFFVPFEVPEGIVEIEVRHEDDSATNVLDWGLQGPDGFRGWGGGNSEPGVVGLQAASRSYVPGPIPAGQWQVVVGKAQITQPGAYSIEIVLRGTATLPPQTRTPYVHAEALAEGPGWYAGDFHVHSEDSGDARPPLSEIAIFARERGLDFVAISDHNVHTAQDFFAQVQPEHPQLLLMPSVEFTTYAGHANVVGATQWVDHKIGQPGVTVADAIAAYHAQGALFTVNHPVLELGPLCIGCAWEHPVDGATIDAVEIATGGLEPFSAQFSDAAIAYWDDLCAAGHHVAALGGSDDHKAGVDLNQFQSPIGDATTLVYAQRLDVPSILEGVRSGRTVVKLQGPDDPTLMFAALEEIDGDTIRATEVTLTAQVLGGMGQAIRLVHNGVAQPEQAIDADPFEAQWSVLAPEAGQDRYRVEVLVDGERRVVASHLWVEAGIGGDDGLDSSGDEGIGSDGDATGSATTGTGSGDSGSGADGSDSGCGCVSAPAGGRPWLLWLGPLLWAARRRGRAAVGARSSGG